MSRQPLKVMISSRVKDTVTFKDGSIKKMAKIRKELKACIEAHQIGGKKLFEVWINEDEPAAAGDATSWEHCMDQARTADIVLVLFNGNAGWANVGKVVGICHAELETALRAGRGRVRVLNLPDCASSAKGDDKLRNEHFKAYVSEQSLFRDEAEKPDQVEEIVEAALRDAVLELTRRGKASSKKDRYDRGPALEWSRLSFADRRAAMVTAMADSLNERSDVTEIDSTTVAVSLKSRKLVVKVDAIPGAMTVAEARELVGRPHLRDHELASSLSATNRCGPLHLIACHRGATEARALSILGFPDAVVVASGFGLYVADNVQKSQLVFLRECRDDTSLRHALQLFFDWLEHSGERDEVIGRAKGRKKVAKAVSGLHGGTP